MVREIIHDPIILGKVSQAATADDLQTGCDLLDTLKANRKICVGMAANMIGISKRIIVFDDNGKYFLMFNPEIIAKSGAYETEEGCLSLDGTRKTVRYKKIKVRYQNEKMQTRMQSFDGFTAQIIQHETDHCNGIII